MFTGLTVGGLVFYSFISFFKTGKSQLGDNKYYKMNQREGRITMLSKDVVHLIPQIPEGQSREMKR